MAARVGPSGNGAAVSGSPRPALARRPALPGLAGEPVQSPPATVCYGTYLIRLRTWRHMREQEKP